MCNKCIHKPVCSKFLATGGVERCEHFKEERKGRWEWYEALVNPYALCSNCGCGLDKRDALNFSYCPYCGAYMTRGAEDGK
jgi:hypothetical protein